MLTLYVVCSLCRGTGKPPWRPPGKDDPTGVLSDCRCGGTGYVPASPEQVRQAADGLLEEVRQ